MEALIRGLPKSLRTAFVPVPPYVDACVQKLSQLGSTDLMQPMSVLLSRWLEELTGVRVPTEALTQISLPGHLLMRYQVVDEKGRFLQAGRNLRQLQERWGPQAAASLIQLAGDKYQRDGIKRWDFGDLSQTVTVHCGLSEVKAYPAVLDAGSSVSLRLLPTLQQSQYASRGGVRRLFMIELRTDLERRLNHAMDPTWKELSLMHAPLGPQEQLREDVLTTLVDEVFLERQPGGMLVHTHEEFEVRVRAGWPEVDPTIKRLLKLTQSILKTRQELALAMGALKPVRSAWGPSVMDLEEQLRQLLPNGFLLNTPNPWRQHLPRYLRGMTVRLHKLTNGGLLRDQKAMDQLQPMLQWCSSSLRQMQGSGVHDAALVDFRFWIEECRIALFAQELKTSIPISIERLHKKMESLSIQT
ncbi:MAG: DUF3418 domain-containing protein [Phycisphaerales bacterium]|nr:DUF3418 domain-containing protein [Phycisphaerales bacterium]